MTTATYPVRGMTCEHCEQAVSREISKIEGVTAAKADAGSGLVEVSSEQPLDRTAVAAAVQEAGYEMGDRTPQ